MTAGDASDAAPRGSRDPPPGLSWPEGMPLPVPAAKKDDEGDEGQENEEIEEEEGFENDPLVEPTPPDSEKKKTKEEDEKKEEPKRNDDKKEEHASQTKPGVWKQLVDKGPGQWVWLRHCRYCKSSSYWRKGCCFKCSSEARLRMCIYEHLTWKRNPLAENYKPPEEEEEGSAAHADSTNTGTGSTWWPPTTRLALPAPSEAPDPPQPVPGDAPPDATEDEEKDKRKDGEDKEEKETKEKKRRRARLCLGRKKAARKAEPDVKKPDEKKDDDDKQDGDDKGRGGGHDLSRAAKRSKVLLHVDVTSLLNTIYSLLSAALSGSSATSTRASRRVAETHKTNGLNKPSKYGAE